MACYWKLIGLLLAATAPGWQAAASEPPIVVSPETTHLTEPLAEDGLPDYSGALLAELREGVTPENNGGILYLRAMWPAGLTLDEHRRAACKELGMPIPEPNSGMESPQVSRALTEAVRVWLELNQPATGATAGDGASDDAAEDLLYLLGNQPWTTEDAPPVAMYIASQEEGYRLLHQAVAQQQFYLPSPSLLVEPDEPWIAMLLPFPQSMRDAARCLAARANLSIGEGELDAAWRDCLVMYALSERIRPVTLVDELVSIAVESIADGVALNLLNSPELERPLALRVLRFYRQRPPRHGMAAAIDVGERGMFLTAAIAYATGRGSVTPEELSQMLDLPRVDAARVDWNVILRNGNKWYDNLVAAMRTEDWPERSTALADWERRIDALSRAAPDPQAPASPDSPSRSGQTANSILAITLPAVKAVSYAEDRRNTKRLLVTVAAALAAHRCDHGGYPKSLDALTPDLLPNPPVDRFHRAPLAYRRTSRGYLLYSLGPNQRDDQGSSHQINNVFRGYYAGGRDPEDDRAIRALLDTPPPATRADGSAASLSDLIPPSADDHAVRLPPVTMPLPGQPAPGVGR
ncbi:hypothetical protein KOR34_49970 [Posidoniimonas corsicana]|uniref:Bacterial type II secretion system protein G n=1 Tax=Posidoniimonas corsicana TaxID=1938618 RepID=A0A5C5UW88_9BACT|nr:hypothetical protein [Posidoniimonas corsicana]TWT30438.1 hypothetical protein KOR34_49970 [Posidoniimonas corsicana]